MFLSKEFLISNYNIDPEIAAFFVDREVPEDNMYWKERKLYLRNQPGYMFIPIYIDILNKIGIEKKELLSKEFVDFFEKILDSAARVEFENISGKAHIANCVKYLEEYSRNPEFAKELLEYFLNPDSGKTKFGTPYKSLSRSDTFLFCLAYLNFDEATKSKMIDYWYAMMTYYLVLDDINDYKEDKLKGEENAVADAGDSAASIQKIFDLIDTNIKKLGEINISLANRFKQIVEKYQVGAKLKSFINH